MNKINKKPKHKTFGKAKPRSAEKTPKTSAKKSAKAKIAAEEPVEEDDNDLRQSLNEIINDFNRGNQKSKNKSPKGQIKEKTFNESHRQPKIEIEPKPTANWNQSSQPKKKKLWIRTEIKWYEMRIYDESEGATTHTYNQQKIRELRKEAEDLLRTDVEAYREQQERNENKKEDFEWIRTVLKSGTLADKLSAHTVLIQDSAVHNLRSVESMLSMVNTKGKRECIMALDNLRDLFIGDLLIPNKKLKTFADLIRFFDDNAEKKARNKQLIMCLFEDQLKSLYHQFLERIVSVSHDTVDSTKQKALVSFYDLLVNNGEQERFLLENVVNKIGDPVNKLAAQAIHLLNQLINQHHPFMKEVVVEEVERLLYRPNIKDRAQYYALCFLSEIIFRPGDRPLANKLIQLYFGFFRACVKKGDVNNKTMSVLITGVHRAFPYSKLDNNLLEDNINTFYKLIHYVNQNTAIQALCLIFNIIDEKQSGTLTDRFYSVLYRQLNEIELDKCSRKPMFLNLVFRAMNRDPILKRVRAFIKRLLQIGLSQDSSLTSAILILISEVMKTKPALSLGREVKVNTAVLEDEDDDEHYEDVPISDDEEKSDKHEDISIGTDPGEVQNSKEHNPKMVSWVHSKNIDTNRTKTLQYDPNIRNPQFCGAELVDLWELNLLKMSYHPTTSLFAEKMLSNEAIDYSGDPITDFSVKHFLDRFVFRNPKRKTGSKASRVFGRVPTTSSADQKTINTKEYVSQSESRIPLDEKFIYDYMKQRMSEKTDDNDSDGSVSDTEFDKLLDRLEPMSKRDFAKDVLKKSKKGKVKDESESELEDQELDEDDAGDDDDLDFDADDPEFAEAFGDVDEELEDALGNQSKDNSRTKKRKKGFDSLSTSLFASADEFSQLLEGNDSDSGLSDEDSKGNTDRKTEFRNRRKLGRNSKKKRKVNRNVLNDL